MITKHFITSKLSHSTLSRKLTILNKTRTPYEFDNGGSISSKLSVSASGGSKMSNNPSLKDSGVQSNTNNNNLKAGTRNSAIHARNSKSKQNSNSFLKPSVNNFQNYTPLNLSSSLVSKKIVNRNLLLNPARFSSQENIDLRFVVKPINSQLDKQALTWASKIDTSLVDKYRLFGRERFQGDYLLKLQQIYIYSYYKCLLLGVNEYRIDQTSDSDHCLVGHAMLYQMLYKRTYSFEINGVFVNYFLDISEDDLNFILSEAKKYDYISSSIVNYGNRFNISNTTIERYIEGLRFAISDVNLDVLFVRLSDQTKLYDFTSSPNLPLANSFWSSDQSKWHYCYDEFSQINGNTLLFGRANFITIKCIDPITLNDFESTTFTIAQDIIIKYEVSCCASSKYYDCNFEISKTIPKKN